MGGAVLREQNLKNTNEAGNNHVETTSDYYHTIF
jgi:hypothetical protein